MDAREIGKELGERETITPASGFIECKIYRSWRNNRLPLLPAWWRRLRASGALRKDEPYGIARLPILIPPKRRLKNELDHGGRRKDGPCPGLFSMISARSDRDSKPVLERTFFAKLRPMTERFDTEALKVNGLTRADDEYPPALRGVYDFAEWVGKNGGKKPMFISTTTASTGSCGLLLPPLPRQKPLRALVDEPRPPLQGPVKDMTLNFKHLRQTRHTHNPVD